MAALPVDRNTRDGIGDPEIFDAQIGAGGIAIKEKRGLRVKVCPGIARRAAADGFARRRAIFGQHDHRSVWRCQPRYGRIHRQHDVVEAYFSTVPPSKVVFVPYKFTLPET